MVFREGLSLTVPAIVLGVISPLFATLGVGNEADTRFQLGDDRFQFETSRSEAMHALDGRRAGSSAARKTSAHLLRSGPPLLVARRMSQTSSTR
jgi:hypothetical protein